MTFGIKITQKPSHVKGKALNVGQLVSQLDAWKKQGKITQEEGMSVVDGQKIGVAKLLGSGEINQELFIRNMRVSEKARQKIEEANGEIEEAFETGTGETKVENPATGEGDE